MNDLYPELLAEENPQIIPIMSLLAEENPQIIPIMSRFY